MEKLSYQELRNRLKELEPTIGKVDLTAKKSVLLEIYKNATQQETNAPVAVCENNVCIRPAPPSRICNVCGSKMELDDNWWNCTHCKNKVFNFT